MTRHIRFWLVLLASGLVTSSAFAQEMRTLVRPRAEEVMTSALRDRLGTQPRVRAWVYFTDKAVLTDASLERTLDTLRRSFTSRAIERRRLRGVPLGFRDVPVHDAYVRAVAATGAKVRNRSRWFNAVSVEASAADLIRVARLPYVASIDVVRGRAERPPAPETPTDRVPRDARGIDEEVLFYGFDPIQYENAQILDAHEAGYTGADVIIAMFDGGFDPSHPALRELPLEAERDFVQGDDVTSDQPENDPPDQTSFGNLEMCHGTATWSTAGGYLPGRHVGVAFGASFAVAKTEYGPYERHVEEDNWAAAAEWADSLGADIISSSLGYRYDFDDSPAEYTWEQLDGKTTIVAQAANIATDVGILVVNSVGNDQGRGDGTRTLNSPSDSDSVLAVGAVLPVSEVITSFSSFGPGAPTCPTCPERIKPDVLAQGAEVHAATAFECYDFEFNPGTPFPFENDGDAFYDQTDIAGTSFSCPITAGAAALLLEAHPSWQPHEIRYALTRTAHDFARGIQPSVTRGYGVIRVMDAMQIPGLGSALPPRRPGPFELIGPLPFSDTEAAISDATPTFIWRTAGPGRFNLPLRYDVELSPSVHFDVDVVTIEDVTDTTATLTAPLPAEGYYYWRVRAEDDSDFPRESRQRWRILHDNPPQPFTLVFPPQDAEVTSSLTPVMTWRRSLDASPVDTVSYTLEIANTPNFANARFFSGLTDTTFMLDASHPLDERQPHYWRVEARDRFGARAMSPTQSFLMGAFPPGPFDLESPADGDSSLTLRPTLSWTEAVDPNPDDNVIYRVFVGSAPDAVDMSAGQTTATELRLAQGLLEDDELVYWKVVAEDSFAPTSNEPEEHMTESAVGSFRTWLAPQPFSLGSPADGGTIFGNAVTFAWTASLDESPGDEITYRVSVYDDEALKNVVATSDAVTSTSVRTELPQEATGTLYWRVRATDSTDRSTWSSEARSFVRSPAPPAFASRAFPNPFDPRQSSFAVTYDVPASLGGETVRIAIHDVTGRVVRILLEEPATVGAAHEATWNGRADNGTRAPAGVYFVRVTLGGEQKLSRVVVIGR